MMRSRRGSGKSPFTSRELERAHLKLAIDVSADGFQALEDIISLGFNRVLTSGLEATCLEGLDNLEQLVKQIKLHMLKLLKDQDWSYTSIMAADRIIIMPGGGITEKNLSRIVQGCGCREFHCSARTSQDSSMLFKRGDIPMSASIQMPEYSIKVTSTERVRKLKGIFHDTP